MGEEARVSRRQSLSCKSDMRGDERVLSEGEGEAMEGVQLAWMRYVRFGQRLDGVEDVELAWTKCKRCGRI